MNALQLLFGFALAMIILSAWGRKSNINNSIEEFLVSSRDLSVFRGAFSIAVSWVWAPAIFIAGLQAYTKGLAGAFWFIAPNILCFFLFAFVAQNLRKRFPNGFTMPEFIKQRFGSKATHAAFLILFLGYQLGAIIINCVAGGNLLNLLTGISFETATIALSFTALLYSVIGGMRASVRTDVIQMIIILGLALFIVPWVIIKAGGLGGIDGVGPNLFDLSIAWAFGIPLTISLLAGPIGDQQFFQRAFSVRADKIKPTFMWGGIIFGIVPIILCLLGFIAANPSFGIEVADPQIVAPNVIAHFLPNWALMLFTLMAFAGLCSTIDSAYCALSSFVIADITSTDKSDHDRITTARVAMILTAIIGTSIALLRPQMLWVFLIYGASASVGIFPTLFSIFNEKYNAKTAFWAIVLGLIGSLPLSAYANITGDTDLIVWSSILSVSIGLVVSLIGLKLGSTN